MSSQKLKQNNSFSNTVSKQILKSIIQDKQSCNSKTIDLQKLKLSQGITYLQNKIDHQTQQINMLSEQLGNEFQLREQALKMLQSQKERTSKLTHNNNNLTKNINDLNKKLAKIQKQYEQMNIKKEESQKRERRAKQLLRKKQEQVNKIQLKSQQKIETDRQLTTQRDELKIIKNNMQAIKSREELLQRQIQELKKFNQYSLEKFQQKERLCIILEETNRRLENQCNQLQSFYEEQQNQVKVITQELQSLMFQKQREINRLKEENHKMQNNYQQVQQPSVYISQVTRIIKNQVKDKILRKRLDQQIIKIIVEMEQGWNRILMNAVSQRD